MEPEYVYIFAALFAILLVVLIVLARAISKNTRGDDKKFFASIELIDVTSSIMNKGLAIISRVEFEKSCHDALGKAPYPLIYNSQYIGVIESFEGFEGETLAKFKVLYDKENPGWKNYYDAVRKGRIEICLVPKVVYRNEKDWRLNDVPDGPYVTGFRGFSLEKKDL